MSNTAQRIVLAAKGVLMGTADIIPGVSGGTMALVLGIYTRLVDAIRSLHLRWLPPLLGWLASGLRNGERRERFLAEWRSMDLGWLINLAIGIFSAIAVAGFILPKLLEDYPEIMRGLFFGLVAGSVLVPWQLVTHKDWKRVLVLVAVAAVTFIGLTAHYEPATTPYVVTVPADPSDDANPVTLETIARRGPSALTPEQLFHRLDPQLQARIAAANPDVALANASSSPTGRSHGHANPYSALRVPPGTAVPVPRPAHWFAFLCGVIAICAMILPGISGSFILLLLGMYYFIVSALKGFLQTLAALEFPATQVGYVGLFALGALIGLVAFSRVLSWLLHHHRSTTMAALAGLMIGSLGVLWPFKVPVADGPPANVLPGEFSLATLLPFGMMLVGAAFVLGLSWLSSRLTPPGTADAALAHDDIDDAGNPGDAGQRQPAGSTGSPATPA